jgi:HTH-type transcriptional regulator/antitoxin HigA
MLDWAGIARLNVKMYLTSLHSKCYHRFVEQSGLFEEEKVHGSPGGLLRDLLESRGWTQEETAFITGTSRQTIAQIVANKSGITPDMALAFGAAFGMPASTWLRLDATYRLSQAKSRTTADVEQRARAYTIAPVREMQKRGWIKECRSVAEIEPELRRFFQTDDLDNIPPVSVATRRSSVSSNDSLTPTQRAWCFRARQLAAALQIAPYKWDDDAMRRLRMKLRELAAYTKEARHLPRLLAEHGIRFVVVEPLPGAKIDGATFWLNQESPVIAVSLRFDRIDNFWFTVMHEFSHVKWGDAFSLDVDLEGEEQVGSENFDMNACEQRANVEASGFLVPELDSFIRRVAPLFSKERIVQFAHATKIHPGIIVGQLRHRGELHQGASKELVVKIRDVVVETALTDGWGKTIAPVALGN